MTQLKKLNRYFASIVFSCLFLIGFQTFQARAATFQKSTSQVCKIQMTGVIKAGDFERFKTAAAKFHSQSYDDSSAANTICLDSPGGSLGEAMKLAAHFYKVGVGTVIEANKQCLSACAFAFMLGNAIGDEIGFVNRRMHVTGTLGFHKPQLILESGESFSKEAVEQSFEAAIQATLKLIEVGNNTHAWSTEPVIPSDLIKKAFEHLGQDFFYIDDVNKVGRWKINIFGQKAYPKMSAARAWNVCENLLRWPSSLWKDFSTHAESKVWGGERVTSMGDNGFRVVSSNSGLADAWCLLKWESGLIKICASDGLTGVLIGEGRCDKENFKRETNYSGQLIALYNPNTKLRDIAEKPLIKARCVVFNGSREVDNEPCTITSETTGDGRTLNHYVWPSGAKTVLEKSSSSLKLNGVSTAMSTKSGMAACYFNNQSGNMFCHTR